MPDSWRERALTEIASIKPKWSERHNWRPVVQQPEPDGDGNVAYVDLFVRFTGKKTGDKSFMLRLRYEPKYETEGRREAFVNPEKPTVEGPQFWPVSISGINPTHAPPTICLEGTWGFHSIHHKERPGRVANLNKLLQEIQRCLDGKV